MRAGAGTLNPWLSRVTGRDVVVLTLDMREQRFLRDHLVDGRPLLPTVLGLESIACAVGIVRPDTTIAAVENLRVGPPFLLPAAGRGTVSVVISDLGSGPLQCAVRSPETDTTHLVAQVVLGHPEPPADAPWIGDLAAPTVRPDLVYGLYFHGPSFQVVGAAQVDRHVARARLAAGLPPILDPPRPSSSAPVLVELCLQAAGLWDLADSARMTIPLGIDRVRRFSDLDSDTAEQLTAVVTPRDGTSVFDAVVVDSAGLVHLSVEGYRTTPFPHPFDRVAAERLRAALGAAPSP